MWFGGGPGRVADFAPTVAVPTMNEPEAAAALAALAPDVTIVFGTGLLKAPMLAATPGLLLNLHGGDPEDYRGLDTHLWAVYHRDFAGLVTTLHRVNRKLDDGDIVLQGAVPVGPGMQLHELRRNNTEVCLRLTLGALDMIAAAGDVPGRPQRRTGRYYSHMPAALKEICVARFAAHTRRLAQSATDQPAKDATDD